MKYEIQFLDMQREGGQVLFCFRVSNGLSNAAVPVGIPIEFDALGSKLSRDERVDCARAWLGSRLDKGECDPFSRLEAGTRVTVPLGVLDYWKENHSIQSWL